METGVDVDLAALLEAFPDAVVAADRSNRIVYANAAAAALVGRDRQALLGTPLTGLMPPRYRPRHREAFGRFFETGEPTIMGRPIRVQALHTAGHEVPIELSLGTIEHGGRRLVVGSLRDVSERMELEHRQAVAARLLDILGEAPTLEAAGQPLLAALGEELGWDVAALWVIDTDGRRLAALASWHDPGHPVDELIRTTAAMTFVPGEGLPGRVWATGKPVWITDVLDDTNFPRAALAAEEGLHGACAFPVNKDGRLLGVIELFSRDSRQADDPLLDVMTTIGEQLGEAFAIELQAGHVEQHRAAGAASPRPPRGRPPR
jgi:PAS domain S-box-containing protein